jgi:ParB-like chromosome segregation protein Spo0J
LGELKTIIAKIESDVLHVPEEVREMLGHDTKIIIGTAAVIAFSAGTSYADVLRSLELIQDDLQLRLSKEKSEASKSRKK